MNAKNETKKNLSHQQSKYIKQKLNNYQKRINLCAENSKVDDEFAEFTDFALDYTEDLRKRWWELPGEKLEECKHLLFRNKIIVQPDGNVYTPRIEQHLHLRDK